MNKQTFTLPLSSLRTRLLGLLLLHYRLLGHVVIFGGLLIVTGLILYLLYGPAPASMPNEMMRAVTLDTASLDALELWIEERQTAYESGLTNSRPEYFVRTTVRQP